MGTLEVVDDGELEGNRTKGVQTSRKKRMLGNTQVSTGRKEKKVDGGDLLEEDLPLATKGKREVEAERV